MEEITSKKKARYTSMSSVYINIIRWAYENDVENVSQMAILFDIPRTTLQKRLTGKSQFKQNEILRMMKITGYDFFKLLERIDGLEGVPGDEEI